jgi:hypothetical protein
MSTLIYIYFKNIFSVVYLQHRIFYRLVFKITIERPTIGDGIFTRDVCRCKAVQVGLYRLLGGIAGVDPRSSSFSNWPLPHLAFLSTLAFRAVRIYAKEKPQ